MKRSWFTCKGIVFLVFISLLEAGAIPVSTENGKPFFTDTENVFSKRTVSDSMAPPEDIGGKVLDEDGNPLIGVNVQIKSNGVGTSTDFDGKFILEGVSEDATLVFSYIGYKTVEVELNGSLNIDVTLISDSEMIDEIVVVGYGSKKKVNLTGAVSQIGAEELEDRPIPNLTQALQGMVPNLNINMGDGRPGKTGSINIRGNTSINGGSPLVLVDGVPGSLDAINPRDVESISVLKDAASSAIYGARAAFGVILVTTKKARDGTINVRYGNNFAWSTPTVSTDFITDGYTSAILNDEAFLNSVGRSYTGYNDQDYEELKKRQTDNSLPSVVIDNRNGKDQYIYYGNTDWWNEIFRDWQTGMEHNVSITGGTEKTNFLLSGRFYQKNGMMRLNQDKFKSYNLRGKIDVDITDWLTVHNNTQFNASTYNYPGWGVNRNFVYVTVHALPSYLPVNPDGTATYRTELNNYTIGDGLYADLLHGKTKGDEKRYNFQNTAGFTLNLGDHFKVNGDYTYGIYPETDLQRRTEAPWSIFPGVIDYIGYDQLDMTQRLDQYQVTNLYGTWDQSFEDHNFKVIVGANQELRQEKNFSGWRKDLLSEDLNELNLGSGDMQINSSASEWAVLGLFNRLSYDYKSKYLVEFNSRYDGTSRFPSDRRFGYFPSISAGWRMSEENFFTGARKVVDNLKLRFSYGALGNQQVGTYAYVPIMNRGTLNYISGTGTTEYLTVPNPIATNPTWETAVTTNFGLDVDLLNSRLSFSVDVYTRETINMLTKGKTLPSVYGAGEPRENAADLKTNGWEIATRWNDRFNISGHQFGYNIGFVLSDYTSTITRFDNPSNLLNDYYVGQELGEMWGYEVDGFFLTDEEAETYGVDQSRVNAMINNSPGEWSSLKAGDVKFIDRDGDGAITNGENTLDDHGDLVVIGNRQPRYSFGINGGANWNGFDMSFFFQGIGKQNWYPGTNADKFWGPFSRPYYSFIPEDFQDKLWSPENPDSYYPRLRGYIALGSNRSLGVYNTRYVQDLAYIRLKNLTLGYTINDKLMERLGLKGMRIYASGENVFTLTKLKSDYIDPEQALGDSNGRVYPFTKNFTFGLDINL
ncbi:SusC/RagA family TonB-linked outer membrane protein [Membranihabitans maritimus]|uniref:SusC/RagA family TonB-linked outer membrane protein n=1 Tax=Membranihabitans maritimus TaxID=2904244 RepID=UPI001F4691B1|nr:TonB-dependent receptor [Membranihabitans maritimus]